MSAGGRPTAEFPPAFISELFHSLSQPLTALSCTLELGLQRDQNIEELRDSVQTALENAECLRQRLLLMRALNDASHSGDPASQSELSAVLRELAEHVSALFEAAGKRFFLTIEEVPCLVRMDRGRLLRALFVLVEYLLRYLVPNGVLTIELTAGSRGQAQIRIDSTSSLPMSPGSQEPAEPYSCELELARRTIAAAGGTLALVRCERERNVWLATLPVANTRGR